MTIASQETTTPREMKTPRGTAVIPPAYGVASLAIGCVLWVMGAWYTASGWAWLLTYVLDRVGLPWVVPQPSGLIGVAAAGIGGYVYSRIELSPPSLRRHRATTFILVGIVWLIIIVSDLGTTLAGTMLPARPDSLALAQWIAATPIAAGVWSAILTFAPEQLILRGIRAAKGQPIL